MQKITSTIDVQGYTRSHKIVGSVTVKELIRILVEIYSSPAFDPNMNSIWDIRGADFSSFSQSDINQIKGIVSRHWAKEGKSKSAIVTGRNDTARMTQFYELILGASSRKKVGRFYGYSEALGWIKEKSD